MFENVLFPTDFSSHARDELECLTCFPHVRNIHLLHVVKSFPIPFVEKIMKDATTIYLRDAKEYLESLNPSVTVTMTVSVARDIAGSILEAAGETGADLVVINGYAKHFRAGILLGRVPQTVLCRISTANVLVMPNLLIDTLKGDGYTKFCHNIFSNVLCPTDFSDFSRKAVACAGATGGARHILLLHVKPEGPAGDSSALLDPVAKLNAIRDSLADSSAGVRSLLEMGDPAREIVRVADREDVSLIWMSAEGKGCLHEFLAGSIVQDVLKLAKRPVLVIRSAE